MSSTVAATGSPASRRSTVSRSQSIENSNTGTEEHTYRTDPAAILKKTSSALSTSKLNNQAPKKVKMSHEHNSQGEILPMDMLLAKLSEQQAAINQQHQVLAVADNTPRGQILPSVEYTATSSACSVSITPATTSLEGDKSSNNTSDSIEFAEEGSSGGPTNAEVARLKLELEKAQAKINRMDQELSQSRITKHTIEQAMGSNSNTDAEFPVNVAMMANEHRLPNMHNSIHNGMRTQLGQDSHWIAQDDARSDNSDMMSVSSYNRAGPIWNGTTKAPYPSYGGTAPDFNSAAPGYGGHQYMSRSFNGGHFQDAATGFGQTTSGFRPDRLMAEDPAMAMGGRRKSDIGRLPARGPASFPYGNGGNNFDSMSAAFGAVGNLNSGMPSGIGANTIASANAMAAMSYKPSPIGTPLSPYAPEFNGGGSQWKTDVSSRLASAVVNVSLISKKNVATEGQTFLPTTEPLNYRRLLDRTVNCNWKYIVDKIVCNNDQQASIFLQQKLKVGTTEQKYDIVEAIVAQAYPLMVNRFGNFLVQRCFEHGTPEQVIKIAQAIRGNTLALSMDAFGCHVVQKAFDSVPEDYKAIMVHELLRRIPETVIHRYACHVWQKLFELRWTESPPQIMKYVNEALRGMWHEVALGETGSLVVQNIFENCLEEDKRSCIEEVLASIDIVAHGQFGNWCIQHICEHGAPADRSRAIDHVIRYASEYSMDQFASKVVEKCLKIGGVEFLSRYLDRVCEGRPDRPRIPLIDIASDQYGNYLIQYILQNSNPQHREMVACHIRKHMVSLRGSKFGSRVGMLCTNPAVATRPGPGVGPAMGPATHRLPPNPRFGSAYR